MARLRSAGRSAGRPKPLASKPNIGLRQPAQPRVNANLQPAYQHPIQAQQAPHPLAPAQQIPIGAAATGGGGDFVGDTFGAGGLAAAQNPMTDIIDTPAIPDANTDPGYIQGHGQLLKALQDYLNGDKLQRTQYDVNYNDALNQLGYDQGAGAFDQNNLQGYYGQAWNNSLNDFAGRGMLNSGAYADELGTLTNNFADRKTGLDTSRGQFLAGRDQEVGTYKNQNTSADLDLLMQAVARLAQQYGVDPSQISTGV